MNLYINIYKSYIFIYKYIFKFKFKNSKFIEIIYFFKNDFKKIYSRS